MVVACLLAGAQAHAASVSAGPIVATIPAALFDPLGTLALSPSQFLVPIKAHGAEALDFWDFDLHFDAAVATLADAGGLDQSVYQADFGAGAISQVTSSGLLLAGELDAVSGYFAPAVDGDGALAYVLFEYLPGQQGRDPGVWTGELPPVQVLPEPSSLLLILASAGLGALRLRRPFSFRLLDRS